MRVLLQFALTAPASLLLGADEKSPRLEKTMQRPLPSSLGSCELWAPAGRRCEAAMAAAAGASPQLPTPVCTCSLGSVLPQLSGVLGPHLVSLHCAKSILTSKGS